MSIPITCNTCGDFIGTTHHLAGMMGSYASSFTVDCPGQGNHSKPVEREESRLFGLINRVHTTFPETNTTDMVEKYVGQRYRLLVWFAIVFGEKNGVLIDNEWCWWRWDRGFFGSGAKKLLKA